MGYNEVTCFIEENETKNPTEKRRERGQKSNEGINFGTFESDRR